MPTESQGRACAPEDDARAGLTRAAFLKSSARSALAVSAFGGASGLLSACGDGGDGAPAAAGRPPARPTGLARVALQTKPTSIDPAKQIGVDAYTIVQNSYEGLTVWQEGPTELAPGLATEWSSNPRGTEWTFRLREGVTFHDGAPLTSTAVKQSFEHYLESEGSLLPGTVGAFSQIDDSDPQVVVVRYDDPFPDLARNAPYLGIISPAAFEGGGSAGDRLERASYGAGAFRFGNGFRGQVLQVSAFEEYWGDGPYLATLEYEAIPEESSRIAALQAGDVDFVPQVSPLPLRRVGQGSRYSTATTLTWGQHYLLFTCDQPPFDDRRMRQAVGFALDRELIVAKIMGGQAEVAESVMPPECYGYAAASTKYPHDPERARMLVEEAAAEGVPRDVRFVYTTSGTVQGAQVGQAVADQLRDAGFDVALDGISAAVAGEELFADERRSQVMLSQFAWINGGPYFFGGGFDLATLARYSNPELTRITGQVQSLTDGPEREDLIKEAQELAQRELFAFNMYDLKVNDVLRAPLTGYESPRNAFAQRFAGMYRPGEE